MQKIIDRAEMCEHFAGEFNGDRSKRDREINAQLVKLKCDRLPSEIKALKIKFQGNAEVSRLLQKYE